MVLPSCDLATGRRLTADSRSRRPRFRAHSPEPHFQPTGLLAVGEPSATRRASSISTSPRSATSRCTSSTVYIKCRPVTDGTHVTVSHAFSDLLDLDPADMPLLHTALELALLASMPAVAPEPISLSQSKRYASLCKYRPATLPYRSSDSRALALSALESLAFFGRPHQITCCHAGASPPSLAH